MLLAYESTGHIQIDSSNSLVNGVVMLLQKEDWEKRPNPSLIWLWYMSLFYSSVVPRQSAFKVKHRAHDFKFPYCNVSACKQLRLWYPTVKYLVVGSSYMASVSPYLSWHIFSWYSIVGIISNMYEHIPTQFSWKHDYSYKVKILELIICS